VREHFGIEAFGVNACHGEAGEEVVVPHEEVSFGDSRSSTQSSRDAFASPATARRSSSAAGELLFLEPDVQRAGTALETPTLVLMIGGVAGKPFEPDWEPPEP
jgi:hypothetical protein